jgi:hypothetical protein
MCTGYLRLAVFFVTEVSEILDLLTGNTTDSNHQFKFLLREKYAVAHDERYTPGQMPFRTA